MKKIIFIAFLAIFSTVPVRAASLDCPSSVNYGETFSCTIYANSPAKIAGINGNFNIVGGSFVQFSTLGSWNSMSSSSAGFVVVNNDGVSGNIGFGRITVKATGDSSVNVNILNMELSDIDYNLYRDSTSKSINVVKPSLPAPPVSPSSQPSTNTQKNNNSSNAAPKTEDGKQDDITNTDDNTDGNNNTSDKDSNNNKVNSNSNANENKVTTDKNDNNGLNSDNKKVVKPKTCPEKLKSTQNTIVILFVCYVILFVLFVITNKNKLLGFVNNRRGNN